MLHLPCSCFSQSKYQTDQKCISGVNLQSEIRMPKGPNQTVDGAGAEINIPLSSYKDAFKVIITKPFHLLG